MMSRHGFASGALVCSGRQGDEGTIMAQMNPGGAPLPPDPQLLAMLAAGGGAPPPPGMDPSATPGDPSMGGAPPADMGLPLTPPGAPGPSADGLAGGAIATATDPNSMAGIISSAIASARDAAHGQLDQEIDAAAQQAQMHPAVQAMMAPPPAPPMSGTGGGAFPPAAGMGMPSGPMVP